MRLFAATSVSAPSRSWTGVSVRGLLARVASWDEVWRQRQALGMLDDRMLDDIGVTRADVACELRGCPAGQARG